ncbi:MAG: MAPEG family protein [Ectothiorhodospiraceae bacterium]|nr:MAPEG family protein [Ectothiorhodospiraceae bacterium]
MTIAYWTVLVAAILPIVFAGVAKAGGERFSNRAPREWLENQAGWRRRAHWAQQNSYEAFAPFAAGVIIAHQLDATQSTINALALSFVALRIIYGICYIGDWHLLRSLCWVGGFLCVIGLFIAAA